MKKTIYLTLVLTMCLILSGCCLDHEWAEATCTTPKTCTQCGKTTGDSLEHNIVDAVCTRCTLTEEEIFFLGEWQCYYISISENSTFPDGTYHAEDFRCTFNSDGTCILNFLNESHEGNWSIDPIRKLMYDEVLGAKPRYVCGIESPTIVHHFSALSAIDFGAKEDIYIDQKGFSALFTKVVPTQNLLK